MAERRAVCGVCSREVSVISSGLLRVHGPRENRCSGSRQLSDSLPSQPQSVDQQVHSSPSPSDPAVNCPPDLSSYYRCFRPAVSATKTIAERF